MGYACEKIIILKRYTLFWDNRNTFHVYYFMIKQSLISNASQLLHFHLCIYSDSSLRTSSVWVPNQFLPWNLTVPCWDIILSIMGMVTTPVFVLCAFDCFFCACRQKFDLEFWVVPVLYDKHVIHNLSDLSSHCWVTLRELSICLIYLGEWVFINNCAAFFSNIFCHGI